MLSIIVLVVAVIILLLFFNRGKGNGTPPYQAGLPYLGCIVQYFINPTEFLLNLRRKHGSIFAFQLAGRYIVLLCDTESIRKYYHASEDILNASEANEDFGFKKQSLHKVPKLARHLLLTEIQPKLNQIMTIFSQKLDQYSPLKESGSFEIFDMMKILWRRSFISTFVGDAMIQETDFLQNFAQYEKLKVGVIIKGIFLPKVFLRKSQEELNLMRQEMLNSFVPIMKSIVENYHKDGSQSTYIDFILRYHESPQLEKPSVETLADYTLDIVLGASTNPAILSSQVLLYLITNPEHMETAREEIKMVFGGKVEISTEKLHNCKFLDLCVKETLRLCTHPIGSMRMAKVDLSFTSDRGVEYTVPAGSFVGLPHNVLAMDETVFSDPYAFNPEHLGNLTERVNKSPFSFIPFSGGRHACPGRNFALIGVKCLLAKWLTEYNFKLEDPSLPKLKWKGGATLATRDQPVTVHYNKL